MTVFPAPSEVAPAPWIDRGEDGRAWSFVFALGAVGCAAFGLVLLLGTKTWVGGDAFNLQIRAAQATAWLAAAGVLGLLACWSVLLAIRAVLLIGQWKPKA